MSYGSINGREGSAREHDADVRSSQAGGNGIQNDVINPFGGEQANDPVNSKNEGRRTIWQGIKIFYERNLGLFFVFLAQVFASLVCKAI